MIGNECIGTANSIRVHGAGIVYGIQCYNTTVDRINRDIGIYKTITVDPSKG